MTHLLPKDGHDFKVADELDSMPFRTLNFSSPADKNAHDRMVLLVELAVPAQTVPRTPPLSDFIPVGEAAFAQHITPVL
jgi:hypothetical protein